MIFYRYNSEQSESEELIETEEPKKGVALQKTPKQVKAMVNKFKKDMGLKHIIAYGNDCKDYGQTADMMELLRALFPPYRTWKDHAKQTIHKNSWSMSMDMFRYILGNMYDEYDDWEVQALPAHSALGDCYEEMILLDLILQLFA